MRKNPISVKTHDVFSVSVPSSSNVNPNPGGGNNGGSGSGSGSSSSNVVTYLPISGRNYHGSTYMTQTSYSANSLRCTFHIPILEHDGIRMISGGMKGRAGFNTTAWAKLSIVNQFTGVTNETEEFSFYIPADDIRIVEFNWKIDSYLTIGTLIDSVITFRTRVDPDSEGTRLYTSQAHFLYSAPSAAIGATEACRFLSYDGIREDLPS